MSAVPAQPLLPEVHLRPYRLDDADRLAQLLNDPDVTAMTAKIPYPYARSDAEAFLSLVRGEEGRRVSRAIALDDDALVGGIGLAVRAGGEEELGYWVGRRWWGQGIATRAVAAFLALLDDLGIDGPIEAQTLQANVASQRVLLANGFVATGPGTCITPARETKAQPSFRFRLER